MTKIYTCSLTEFVRRFPVYKKLFSNLLTDPEYIVKYRLFNKKKLQSLEVGYQSDIFAIDNEQT